VLTSLFSESHMNLIEQKSWIGIDEKLFLTRILESFFHKRLGAIQKSKFFGNHYELI